MVDASFSYRRVLIVCYFLQEFFTANKKYSACDLKCTYRVFTMWGRRDNDIHLVQNNMINKPFITHKGNIRTLELTESENCLVFFCIVVFCFVTCIKLVSDELMY